MPHECHPQVGHARDAGLSGKSGESVGQSGRSRTHPLTRKEPPFIEAVLRPTDVIVAALHGEMSTVSPGISHTRHIVTDIVHQPIVVTHEGGVRFAAQVRSHRVIVDQPERSGGVDSGPMPLELLGAALGTCIAYYVQQFMHARGLSYDGLRVEIEQHKATGPSRIGAFVARVVIPTAVPPAYIELLQRVARSCPAHGTLTHASQVHVTIETAAAAAA